MKNSIKKFKQLFESFDLDDESIKDLTQDLKDELDGNLTLKKGYFNESSKSARILNENPTSADDKLAYLITIDYNKLGFNKLEREAINHTIRLFNDDRFFELFNQLRLISKRCKTYTEIGDVFIRFIIVSDEKLELEEDPELYRLFTQVRDRFDKLKSDFGYNTIVKFEDNKIIIKTDNFYYTDRKLNLALRGLSILDDIRYTGPLKMTKHTEGEGVRGEIFNIIEKK
jgi:hypothetical protein